jgi:hypothetical protein
MQQYMVLHTVDPDDAGTWGDEHWDALTTWLNETIAANVNMAGDPVRSTEDAITVKVRGGQLIVTDGPFADVKEWVSGYDVLQCASLDEAVRWAGKHPSSWFGPSEVRALVGDPIDFPRGPVPAPAEGKTRYMMFVCTDPSATAEDAADATPIDQWVGDTGGRGVRVFGSQLAEPGDARLVRVQNKQTIVTDGPFAEAKEQIAGFDVLDCADLDEAIATAAAHPMARAGLLELRPFRPLRED